MFDGQEIISSIGENAIGSTAGHIDLSRATPIGSGSTCDVYRTRWRSRMVCVKRIRPEYQADPVVRQALRKEFELGFSLSHPAIPQYLHEGSDFIVMDFVEGETVRNLIGRHDTWLSDPENQKRMMRELVDALEYLHSHHIVHCDIKTDNVMITDGTRRAMIIDLGLSHTDWLDSTAGDPSRFGLDASDYRGDPSVDYRALAIVAERIGNAGYDIRTLDRFISRCRKPGVSAQELREALSRDKRRRIRIMAVAIAAAVVTTAGVSILLTTDNAGSTEAVTFRADSTAASPTQAAAPQPEPTEALQSEPTEASLPHADKPAAKTSDFKKYITENTTDFFRETEKQIKEQERRIAREAETEMTDSEIFTVINRMIATYNSEYAAACNTLRSRFPDVDPIELEMAMATDYHTDLLQRRQNAIQALMEVAVARDSKRPFRPET